MLSDDDVMKWSKYRGRRLRDVPTAFWAWWLDSNPDRACDYPETREYALDRVGQAVGSETMFDIAAAVLLGRRKPLTYSQILQRYEGVRISHKPPPTIMSDSVIEDPYADA